MNKLLVMVLLISFGCAQKPVAKEPLIFMEPGETYEAVKIDNKKFERSVLYKAYLLDGDHITFEFSKLETPFKFFPDNWKSDKEIAVLYYGKYLTHIVFDEHDSKELVEANIAFLQKEVKGHKIYLPIPSNLVRVEHLIIIKE